MEAVGFSKTAVNRNLSNYAASLPTITFVINTGANGAQECSTLAAWPSNRTNV